MTKSLMLSPCKHRGARGSGRGRYTRQLLAAFRGKADLGQGTAEGASEGCGFSQIFDDFTLVQLIDDARTLVDDGNNRRRDNQRLQCIEAGEVEGEKVGGEKVRRGTSKRAPRGRMARRLSTKLYSRRNGHGSTDCWQLNEWHHVLIADTLDSSAKRGKRA